MSLDVDFYPTDFYFDFHPEGPRYQYWRRQFLNIQDRARPPGERERSISPTDSEPDLYPPPETPSPPSSIATMDLEILDMGRRTTAEDEDEEPVHTPPRRRTRSVEPSATRLSYYTPSNRWMQNPHYPRSVMNTPAFENVPTPHAIAARRALDQRRLAMFTPGRSRRQSFREQRETPMLILRNLGRALAPTSNVIDSSSSPDKTSPDGNDGGNNNGEARGSGSGRSRRGDDDDDDDDDDELPIDRPRLSLPLDEGSSDDLQPPQSSILDEGNMTVQSVELPRRATSEGPLSLRGSLSYFPGISDDVLWDDPSREHTVLDSFGRTIRISPQRLGDPNIADLRRPVEASHESDFIFDIPSGLSDNDQTTFYMRSPVIDDIHSVLNAPNSVADDIALMHAKSRQEVDKSMASVEDQEDQFPDIGDFGSVSSLGDAEMEAVTQIDFETLGREPEKTDDDVMGYPHGRPRKKKARISRHNIEYPQLPAAFVRQVAHTAMQTTGFVNQRISADTLEALTQASDWYFEQLGDDLAAYANHANRRTIEERDVITLMNRQRLLSQELSLFNLANRHLPRELQQMLRCAVPAARPNGHAGHSVPSTHTHTHTTYAPRASGGSKRKRAPEEHDEKDDEEEEMVYPEDEEEEGEEEEEEEDEE
ncbi:centromere kinetochore component CENP-T domain-containing protein [Trichoderma longibrachiatum]